MEAEDRMAGKRSKHFLMFYLNFCLKSSIVSISTYLPEELFKSIPLALALHPYNIVELMIDSSIKKKDKINAAEPNIFFPCIPLPSQKLAPT